MDTIKVARKSKSKADLDNGLVVKGSSPTIGWMLRKVSRTQPRDKLLKELPSMVVRTLWL